MGGARPRARARDHRLCRRVTAKPVPRAPGQAAPAAARPPATPGARPVPPAPAGARAAAAGAAPATAVGPAAATPSRRCRRCEGGRGPGRGRQQHPVPASASLRPPPPPPCPGTGCCWLPSGPVPSFTVTLRGPGGGGHGGPAEPRGGGCRRGARGGPAGGRRQVAGVPARRARPAGTTAAAWRSRPARRWPRARARGRRPAHSRSRLTSRPARSKGGQHGQPQNSGEARVGADLLEDLHLRRCEG